MNLLIIGFGSHGRVASEVAMSMIDSLGNPFFENITFLDDENQKAAGKLADYKLLFKDYQSAFVAFGNNHFRKEWMDRLKQSGFSLPSLIDRSAIISSSVNIGEGCIIEAGAIINTGAVIGKGSIISIGALIDHDCRIGEYCHINCGSVIHSMQCIDPFCKVENI